MTNSAPPPGPVQNLPVWQAVRFAYASLVGNLAHLPAAALLPFLLSFAIGKTLTSLAVPGDPAGIGLLPLMALGLLGYVPIILFAVAWYRLLLLGPAQAPPRLLPTWGRRHWRQLGYTLALLLIFMIAGGVLMAIVLISIALIIGIESQALNDQPVGIAAGLVTVLVVCTLVGAVLLRFCFIYPAAAVDEDYGFGESWRHTKGQTLRLLTSVVLTSLPPFAVLALLGSVLGVSAQISEAMEGDGSPPADLGSSYLTYEILSNCVSYLWIALLVGLVAFAFRTCTGWVPASPSGPAPGSAGTLDSAT